MKPIILSKIILTLGVFSIAALAVADENTASTNQPPSALMPQQFVSDAAMGGMKEIFLSKLALEKSTNADVKNFAKRMVKDHRAANERLAKIAENGNLDFPPTNTFSAADPNWSNPLITNPEGIKGAQMLTMTNLPYLADYQAVKDLQSLNGDQFDQLYVSDMVSDHVQAVSEFENAAQSLSDPKLKRFAERTLPTLRKHSEMAQELSNKSSASGGTNTVNQPGSTMTSSSP